MRNRKILLYSSILLGVSGVALLSNSDNSKATSRATTTLGSEAKKDQFVKNANIEKVINLHDGLPYNFMARWYPKDTGLNADGFFTKIPSNVKILADGDASDLYVLKDKDGKTPKLNYAQNKATNVTFMGFKGESGKSVKSNNLNGILYEGVGYVNGHSVDLEITISSYVPYANKESQRGISFPLRGIGLSTTGLSDVGFRYKFKYHDPAIEAKTPLNDYLKNTGWVLTFADIDANQSVKIYEDSYNGANKPKALWAKPTSPLLYSNANNQLQIKAQDSLDHDTKDVNQSFTAVFDKNEPGNSKAIHWLKDFAGKDKNKDDYWGVASEKYPSSKIAADYLGYSGIKPATSLLTSPDKKVWDSDERLGQGDDTYNKLSQIYEKFNYQLTHYVPYESEHYKDYRIEDILDANLKIDPDSIKIYRRNGTGGLTSSDNYFTKKVEQYTDSKGDKHDKLVITANADALNGSLYDKEFVVKFSVQRKPDAPLPKDGVAPETYKNVAHVYAHASNGAELWIKDKDGKESNVTNEVRTDSPAVIKEKIDKNQNTKSHNQMTHDDLNAAQNEEVNYQVDYKIPNTATEGTVDSIHLWDAFPTDFVSNDDKIKIQKYDNGKWIDFTPTKAEDLKQNNTTSKYDVTISGDTAKSLIGSTIRITKSGKVKSDAYGKTLSNTGSMSINEGKEQKSNTVIINTPNKLSDIQKGIKASPSSDWEKDNDLSGVIFRDNPIYEIKVGIPEHVTSTQTFHFWDPFDKLLTVQEGENNRCIKVYNKETKQWEVLKPTDANDVQWHTKKENGITTVDFTIKGKTLEKLAGQTIMLYQGVKLNGVGLTENTKIHNKAFASLDDQKVESNDVTMSPKITTGSATKYVWNGHEYTKDKQTGLRAGDTVKYKIDYVLPTHVDFDNVHIWDNLDQNLDLESAQLSMDGKPISDDDAKLTIDKEHEKVDWNSKTTGNSDYEKYAGKTITLEITSKVKQSAIQSDKETIIPNKSAYELDNASKWKKESNTVEVSTVKKIAQKIQKFIIKDGKKESTLNQIHCGDKIHYQLEVQMPDGENYKQLGIKDDLNDFINLDSVKIMDGSKDITSQGTLTKDDQKESFMWESKDSNSIRGKKLTIDIEGTLKYSYDIKDGMKIENVAQLIKNGESTDSNTVTVVPEIIQAKAEKWIGKAK